MEPQLPIRVLLVLPCLLFLDLAAPQSSSADCTNHSGTLGGVMNGNVCCPSSCEECQQQDCLEGACCCVKIAETGDLCSSGFQEAPCVLPGVPDVEITSQGGQASLGPSNTPRPHLESGFTVHQDGSVHVNAPVQSAIYIIFESQSEGFTDPHIEIAPAEGCCSSPEDCCSSTEDCCGSVTFNGLPSNFKFESLGEKAFALIDKNLQVATWCYQVSLTPPQPNVAPIKTDPKIYNNHPDCIPSEDEVKTPVPVP